MLHRHKLDKLYLHFGGHIELNEDPWQTIIHELREEAGYNIAQLKVLQPELRLKKLSNAIVHPVSICYNTHSVKNSEGHFHTDSVFAFTTKEPPKYPIAQDESGDIKLFTRQDIVELPKTEIFPMAREMALFLLDEILPNWEQIPALDI